jgi:hypothetical protein
MAVLNWCKRWRAESDSTVYHIPRSRVGSEARSFAADIYPHSSPEESTHRCRLSISSRVSGVDSKADFMAVLNWCKRWRAESDSTVWVQKLEVLQRTSIHIHHQKNQLTVAGSARESQIWLSLHASPLGSLASIPKQTLWRFSTGVRDGGLSQARSFAADIYPHSSPEESTHRCRLSTRVSDLLGNTWLTSSF